MTTESNSTIRVFLASSIALEAERGGFEQVVAEVAEREFVARQVRLDAILWEKNASGIGKHVQDAIDKSVDIQHLDIAVFCVGEQLTDGVAREFECLSKLWRRHRSPKILVYIKEPSEVQSPEDAARVDAFSELATAAGVVPARYKDVNEFRTRLANDLPQHVVAVTSEEPVDYTPLLGRFRTFGWIGVGFGAALITFNQTTSLEQLNSAAVLAVLLFPIVLFILILATYALFYRVLKALARVWQSPAYSSEFVLTALATVLPPIAFPRTILEYIPRGGDGLIRWFVLLIFFLVPLAALVNHYFEEFGEWHLAVRTNHVAECGEYDLPQGGTCGKGLYVDRQRSPFDFGLVSEKVQCAYDATNGRTTIFVFSSAGFDRNERVPNCENVKSFVAHEVFLPQQPIAYLLFIGCTALLVLAAFYRMFTYRTYLEGLWFEVAKDVDGST